MTPLHTDGRVKDSDLELQLDGNTGRTFGLFAESMEMAALVSSGQNTGLSRVRRMYIHTGWREHITGIQSACTHMSVGPSAVHR